MRHPILLPRALILLLSSAPAHAGDLGWTSFAAACPSEFNPEWAVQAERGKAWEKDSLTNVERLRDMSEKVCPEYFRRPNDSDAIKLFSTKKAEVLDHSPKVERDGKELTLFIVTALRDYQATFAEVGIDFSQNPCASHLKQTANLTRQRLDVIQARVKALAETCFSGTAKEAAANVKLKHAELPQNGKTQAVPQGKGTKTRGSDITGTEKKTPTLPKK